jgi:ubiquinone/menaquinone biosynthesis C-methylase UbiE
MQATTQKNIWNDLAKRWMRLTSPLRPCDQDLDLMKQGLKPVVGQCLLLGVTPEFYSLSGNLIAIDNNASMIKAVWPGNNNGKNVVQGDWVHLPFRAGAFDAVIGDGSLTLMHYPLSYELLFSDLKRVLKNPGKLLLRLFATPEEGETCSEVCREALEGKIGNFHAFKWRLAMALVAESGDPNVRVKDIYKTFNRFYTDKEKLAKQTSWKPQDIADIEDYKESSSLYSFPRLSHVRPTFQPYFKEIGILNGTYELAERCPVLILESS